MKILMTGATGQLGRELVPRLWARGDYLTLLVRDEEKARKLYEGYIQGYSSDRCSLMVGDVTEKIPEREWQHGIDAVYHLAADINLGKKHEERTWKTNYTGTKNVIEFCEKNDVPHLYDVSTAYTVGLRNPYEKSKAAAEEEVLKGKFKKTIFKPGIIMPSYDWSRVLQPSTGAVYQFARGICSIHQRAEIVRRAIEGTLRLPVLEPKFRLKGKDQGKINLVPVNAVADFIAGTLEEGTYWLTHPDPPTVGMVARCIGEAMYVDITVEEEFEMSSIEALFHKMAAPFVPYLQGDDFHSDLSGCPPITDDFIRDSVRHSLL
jgi:nucleoside-diphosphate-sugar epimerase